MASRFTSRSISGQCQGVVSLREGYTIDWIPAYAGMTKQRGKRVMADADLAELYGVTTKRLNEQVKRNIERLPADFMFQLSQNEKTEVVTNCDHFAKLICGRAV